MKASKTKDKKIMILAIVAIILIAILAFVIIKNTTGNATKMLDSKTTTATNLQSPISEKITEFNIPTKEQLDTKQILQEFTKNTEIELKLDKPVNAFSLTGNAALLSEAGLIRIILVDSDKHEYLVYEINSLLSENNKQINFENTCEETCVLDKPVTPVAIKIQVEDATLNLSSINTLPEDKQFTEIKDIKSYKQQTLRSQNQAKIKKYNSSQKSWTAGETSVSNLSYEEQKRLFTKEDGTIPEYLPNFQGFLNYKGGIFILEETNENNRRSENQESPTTPDISSNNIIFPDSWDWRNVHGENWNTPVKNQMSEPACNMFSVVGSVEAIINLYYNKHLNIDLSEQSLVSNSNTIYRAAPIDGFPPANLPQCETVFNFDTLANMLCGIKNAGLCDENCYPYTNVYDTFGIDENGNPCNYPDINNCTMGGGLCSNYENRNWEISNFLLLHSYATPNWFIKPLTEKELKQDIIKYGPLAGTFSPWSHSMTIVGYSDQSDWKISEVCSSDEICGSTKECIPRQCNILGDQMQMCVNSFETNNNNSVVSVFECQEGANSVDPYSWQWSDNYICDLNQKCVENQCQDEILFNLVDGYTDCSALSIFGDYRYPKVIEYSPGQGSSYYIFKNSWGEDFGENGYVKMLSGASDLTARIVYSPITPPTDTSYWPANFNNTINCEDKDGDNYCNWGISEDKPSTCPSFCNAEKDCDDSNPDLLGFVSKTNLNCKYKYETEQ
ncbi:MAG: C1 family peptidase [archaeon]